MTDEQFPQKRLPDAIIIGAKKCGTRAVLEFLRLNPFVKAPFPEIHFFDKRYDEGLDWYRDQMPETTMGQVTLEKSPSYFVDKRAPERVHTMNPTTKLILVVRDPVTRIISDYTQTVVTRKLSPYNATTFDGAVLCKVNAKRFDPDGNCKMGVNTSIGLVRIGIYHKHLQHWLRWFPLQQFIFVDGEQVINSPAKELNRIETFLGLVPVISAKDFVKDPQKGFPCMKKNNTVHCLGKTKGRRHVSLRPNIVNRLRHFYKIENIKFFTLINRVFNWT